jgi:RNA polymerase sigma factor (sigma-70 family)
MTGTRPAELLRHLEQPGADDRALVNRYASHNDQAAFAELVRRHGPLVWAACLRVAGHRQDAEDAFQAAFLVLVRRCAAIRNLDLLGNWLYGVAVRVAMKARRSAARRRAREVQVPTMPDPPSPAVEADTDLGPVLDEELAALPAWYRDAVVLCDLRGVSRDEAARLLGVPEGTLSSRLANGRKRLAARLAKRGVALSAAAVPSALGQGARAAVPPELVAAVCRVANGSAVPLDVTRLARGEFTMTTKLLLGVAGAVLLAAGAVFATQTTDPPKPGAPPKPPVVAKGDPTTEQKPDPDAKSAEKVVLAAQPRMRVARDYPLAQAYSIRWSQDGNLVAIDGVLRIDVLGQRLVLLLTPDPTDEAHMQLPLEDAHQLVGFSPGGKDILTDQRERGLVSGLHRLRYIPVTLTGKTVAVGEAQARTVDLDAGDTHGYAFAADGKTFRTLAFTTAAGGGIRKITVTAVDAATGKTLKTLLTAEGEFDGYGLSRHGDRLGVVTAAGDVAVFDVDSGKRLWSKEKQITYPAGLPNERGQFSVVFSPDGKRLVVVGGQRMRPVVFDAEKGEALPKLENIEYAEALADPACLSRDGRLLVLHGLQFVATRNKLGNPVEWSPRGAFLCVWDTDTGTLLKQWNHRPTAVAFHPSKPILAIVEANGENKSRLGLWDFAAEVEKK